MCGAVKLIVGLGNPGRKYDGTRHNIGFDVVDALASRFVIDLTRERFHGWFGLGEIGTERVAIMRPTTFMNRSGQAVQAAGRFYKLELDQLLVISDDLALPLGRLRMRAGGSSGGHKGLQDIMDRVGSDAWCRLRIGIGDPFVGDAAAHVLQRFGDNEQPVVERAQQHAVEAVVCWIENGTDLTMTRFNGDPPTP